MKVHSPIANMDLTIGRMRRVGNSLQLSAGEDSAIPAEVTIQPGEVFQALGRLLTSPSALLFIIGLPIFWLRQKMRPEQVAAGSGGTSADINKPW